MRRLCFVARCGHSRGQPRLAAVLSAVWCWVPVTAGTFRFASGDRVKPRQPETELLCSFFFFFLIFVRGVSWHDMAVCRLYFVLPHSLSLLLFTSTWSAIFRNSLVPPPYRSLLCFCAFILLVPKQGQGRTEDSLESARKLAGHTGPRFGELHQAVLPKSL